MPTSSPKPGSKRKTVKHVDLPREPRFLTYSTYHQRPLLDNDTIRTIVVDAIDRACMRHGFVLVAWALMPDHVHLVVVPWFETSLASGLLYAIKRPASYRIKEHLRHTSPSLVDQLTIRERPGKRTFRFWQEGPGHDRNVRSSNGLEEAITYAHLNPIEADLCTHPEQWPWSSARCYACLPDRVPTPRVVRWSRLAGLEWDGPDDWFAQPIISNDK